MHRLKRRRYCFSERSCATSSKDALERLLYEAAAQPATDSSVGVLDGLVAAVEYAINYGHYIL